MVTENPAPSAMLSAVSVLDSLIRTGMRHIVLSPGSRSAPLAYAVAAAEAAGAVVAHVRVDERVAGFTALGIAKASGRPVGLVCTSGTALGEYVPAVMEAYHSGVPLAVLSADRPVRLRGTGANQTTFQQGFFGRFVRAWADLTAYPELGDGPQTVALRRCLAVLAGRDEYDWSLPGGEPVGPAHINLCVDAPLVPDANDAQVLPRWAGSLVEDIDYTAQSPQVAGATLSPTEVAWLRRRVSAAGEGSVQAPKTVVVAGDGAGWFAAEFASAMNLPLLAEPSSGARGGRTAIPHYVELLGAGALSQLGTQIERVVLMGHPTLSRPISALLNRAGVPQTYYAPRPASWYEPGARTAQEVQTPEDLEDFALGGASRGADAWVNRWAAEGAKLYERNQGRLDRYRSAQQDSDTFPDSSGSLDAADRTAGQALACSIWQQCAADHRALVLGSSNLVRDLDAAASGLGVTAPQQVYANRGLAGIDGTVATAIGVSLAGYYPTGRPSRNGKPAAGGAAVPVRLLCGDLTFQHDISALNLPVTELLPDLEVHVLDDGGGSIFATLEHGKLAQNRQFTAAVDRFFTVRAANNTDVGRMAAGFGAAPGAPQAGITVHIHKPNPTST